LQNLITSRLFIFLKNGTSVTGEDAKTLTRNFPNLCSSIDKILVRKATGYEEVSNVYEDASGALIIDTIPLSDQPGYVNLVNRVSKMNNLDRSGDIVLLMKDSTYASKSEERYTTGVACKSWHGSLSPSDSYVPLIVSYPGGNLMEVQQTTNTVCSGTACSGNWALTGLVKDFARRQLNSN